MDYPIEVELLDSSVDYYSEVVSLKKEATNYLESHRWCDKIHNGWLYINFGKILCIFLFKIDNNQSDEDNLIWVMVGDFPAIYLDTFNCRNTKEVVETYIYLAEDWVAHAESNKAMDNCFPFNADLSLETINNLKHRLLPLKNIILENMDNIELA